jgi:tetratricopeptide (TPR) repeat protein
MNKSNYKLIHRLNKFWRIFIASSLVLCIIPHISLAGQAVMSKIQIEKNPLSVKFSINSNIPVKVIKVESNELLIALKNVALSKNFKISGKEQSGIKRVGIDNLPGNVLAVILTSSQPYGYIKSEYNQSASAFIINLEKSQSKPAPLSLSSEKNNNKAIIVQGPEKKPQKKQTKEIQNQTNKEIKTEVVPVPAATLPAPEKIKLKKQSGKKQPEKKQNVKPIKTSSKIAAPSVYAPPKRERGEFRGDISDIYRKIDGLECDSKHVTNAVMFLKKNMFKEAFEVLDQYIVQEKFTCLEQVHFLKAYAFYKNIKKDDFAQLLKAQQLFQEALVSFPQSSFLPYGYGAIGVIQKQLNNMSAALGYFNIVKKGYLEYSGLPEIMYHLADIYDSQGYLDKALRYYKQVFEDPVENSYILDAGIGYGKALFTKRRYRDSLMILNYVVKSNQRTIYDSHELLLHIGNANFEVGNNKLARVNLNRVLNLFPEIEDRDVILSKIGDTYGMENNSEKAIKIYELVREKYPDSKGFISSSIGIARYLETDEEKIEIYEMIKNKFPDDKFARIAMMRLAEIYQTNGEHNKCIKEIEDLLSTHPRGLRYEAVKLMQKAYEALFKKQLKSDEYTKVLNRYELEHTRIDRMGSQRIALSVGLAYLQAKLYEESFNHLINAYKQYKRSSRPSQLLFGLGVAMDESGRDDDALKLFSSFSKRFPKSKFRKEALSRAGNIYLEKSKYKLSSSKFKLAYKAAENHLEKGKVILLHSNVYAKKGDMKTAAKFQENAVREFALASGENYDVLTKAYKALGQTYIALKKYVKSADAYSKALDFSKDDIEKSNLGFLIGDAYQKGNILTEAKKAFKQVVETYDSIWARMAQQRLSTLELAQIAQNS